MKVFACAVTGLLGVGMLLPACSGADPVVVDATTAPVDSTKALLDTTATPDPTTEPPVETVAEFPNNGDCEYMSMQVDAPLESSEDALTFSPFDLSTIRMFINGSEGNGTDPRFSYVEILNEGEAVPIYAPAPMLLVNMRLKDGFAVGSTRESGDWDLTFVVSCEMWIRINHITDPDPRILDAYGFADEPGTYWTDDGEKVDDESKMVPVSEVRLEAGDLIGYTRGTPVASNFDFVVAIDAVTVCPWEQFTEPVRSELLAKLGPPPASPDEGPVPGWPCDGYGGPM